MKQTTFGISSFFSAITLILILTATSCSPLPPGQTIPDLAVYTDSLAPGWTSGHSWATVDMASTEQKWSGTCSIRLDLEDDGAISFEPPAGAVTTGDYRAVRLRFHGGTEGNQPLFLVLVDATAGAIVNRSVTPRPTAGIWKEITIEIPVTAGSSTVLSFEIDSGSLVADLATFYVDQIELVGR